MNAPKELKLRAALSENEHAYSYLEYYVQRKEAPLYAVMIKGKWGSGKTWFVKEALKKLPLQKSVYVSLNGISSCTAIENEIFREIHPILGSKGMQLAGRVLTGAVRATLKIDLNGDARDDVNTEVKLPTLNIPDYLKVSNEFVLVFDDLERCAMPVHEALGYINHFVEHDGIKVIVLANEEEIERTGGETNPGRAYGRIKEKIFGKELEIEPDLHEAIEAFLKSLGDLRSRETLTRHAHQISGTFSAAGYKNLRLVRQAILDLERIISTLSDTYVQSNGLMGDFVARFLAYFTEIRAGAITAEDIGRIQSSFYNRFSRKENEEKNLYETLSEKYVDINFLSELLEPIIWRDLICAGRINTSQLEEAFSRSKHFASELQPVWVKLWHAYELEDAHIKELVELAAEEFFSNDCMEKGVLLHLFGELLWMSDLGIYSATKDELLIQMKLHVDRLAACDLLPSGREIPSRLSETGHGGLGFHCRDDPAFISIISYFSEAVASAQKERAPKDASMLLDLMQGSPRDFERKISLTGEVDNQFWDSPILAHIDPSQFVSAFIDAAPSAQLIVQSALRRRYERDEHLGEERKWREKTTIEIDARMNEYNGTMLNYRLGILKGILSSLPHDV